MWRGGSRQVDILFVAAIGFMLAYLPSYSPSGVIYSPLFWQVGIPILVLGLVLTARGLWKRRTSR